MPLITPRSSKRPRMTAKARSMEGSTRVRFAGCRLGTGSNHLLSVLEGTCPRLKTRSGLKIVLRLALAAYLSPRFREELEGPGAIGPAIRSEVRPHQRS